MDFDLRRTLRIDLAVGLQCQRQGPGQLRLQLPRFQFRAVDFKAPAELGIPLQLAANREFAAQHLAFQLLDQQLTGITLA